MKDKNGVELYAGLSVIVDDPGESDDWKHGFRGSVDSLDFDFRQVIVEDQDMDIFWVDPGMVEVIDEEWEE